MPISFNGRGASALFHTISSIAEHTVPLVVGWVCTGTRCDWDSQLVCCASRWTGEYLHANWALASGPWIIAWQSARVADMMLIAALSTFSRHAKLSGRG